MRSLSDIWGTTTTPTRTVDSIPTIESSSVKTGKKSLSDIWGIQPLVPEKSGEVKTQPIESVKQSNIQIDLPKDVSQPSRTELPVDIETPSGIEQVPERIPIDIAKLSEDPDIAKLERNFYDAPDPRSKALSLKSFPSDKGKLLFGSLPEDEQKQVGQELNKLVKEDRKANAFAIGILESTPVPAFLPEESIAEIQKIKEAAPLTAAAGQITGTIAQAIVGGHAIGGVLSKFGPVAKSPLLKTALTRILTSGAIAAEQNIGRKELGEAMQDVAQQGGGGLISIVPEVLAPPGVAQVIAQPLTDLIYDVGTGALRGQNIGTKEWWVNEIVSLASSAGFAVKDATSGKVFTTEQAAQREELNNLFKKNKNAKVEIIESGVPVGRSFGVVEGESQLRNKITSDIEAQQEKDLLELEKELKPNQKRRRKSVEEGMYLKTEDEILFDKIREKYKVKPTKAQVVKDFNVSREKAGWAINNIDFEDVGVTYAKGYGEGTETTSEKIGTSGGSQEKVGTDLGGSQERARVRDDAEQRVEAKVPEEVRPESVEEKIQGMEKQPSPLTMGGLSAEQELPKYAGNINLNRIDAGADPKKVILETSADYEGKIDEARRGVITHEATRKLADDLGMTERELLRRRKGKAFNAEEALAARDLLNASANRVVELKDQLAVKRKDGKLTDEDLANFSLEIKKHAAIQAEVAGITAEAGRALGAFRIMSEAKQKAKSVEGLLNIAGGKEINEEILDKLIKIDPENTAATNKFIKKSVFAKTTDAIYEYWINAILSAPTTHVTNTVSNLATGAYRTLIEKPISAAIDLGISRAQNRPVERFFGEMPAELYGFGKGLGEAWASFKDTWKTGIPSGSTKIEGVKDRGVIPGKAGKVIRTPTRLLAASDEFFKTVIYRGTMQSLAYRQAKSEGLKGAELNGRVDEILKNPTDDMMSKARSEAEYRTFTNPLGKTGKSIMKLRTDTPGLKYIIPFIKTPTNIAKFALKRMPGFSQAILAKKLKSGELKDAEISDEIAKGTAGTALAMLTVMLAKNGMITGGGPKEKNKRDELYRTGWMPYSIKIGDRYYSYNRLEPIASVVGTAADFATMDIDKMNEEQLTDIATKLSYSFGKNITSKTFMQGISDLIDVVSDPGKYGKQFIDRRTGSLIPNIVAATARATDDELKEIENINETIMSRIPGLSHEVMSRRDIWGRPIKKSATGIEAFLSPVQVSKESDDPIDKEMLRVNAEIGLPSDRIRYKGETIKLDSDIYDKYLISVGKYARQKVELLINSARYKRLSDEDKKDSINSIFKKSRAIYRKSALRSQLLKQKG